MFKKIIVGALVLALLAGLGVWALNNNNNQDDSRSANQSQNDSQDQTNSTESSQEQSQGNEEVADVTVTYNGDSFEPSSVGPISAGTAVKFVNNSDKEVWIASDEHPTHEELPDFDTKSGIGPGAEYTYTFTLAGTWSYHNHLNERQTGRVVVE